MKKLTQMLTLSSALLVGCSKVDKVKTDSLGLVGSNIFSDRPQNTTDVVVLVQLKSPALFARDNVTENEKKALLEEQKKALEEIQDLEPSAKLLFSYRFVLNALAVVVPKESQEKIAELEGVSSANEQALFKAPTTTVAKGSAQKADFEITSTEWIGVKKAYELGHKGKGMSVGIIDSGIDYTHSMFEGPGTEEVYKSIDPLKDAPENLYPNNKVVGGIDLVGEKYSPGNANPENRIPVPDNNPIDLGGHGTHVGGTVAGIGDGVKTYDGVAPEAKLHAIKVFGAGATSDAVVIAALEYSADPNQDMDPADKLDVVNLSLGGPFGKPVILYTKAIKNLSKSGVVVVASAGNSGDVSYITGAPASSADAFSIGASVDGMKKNWNFGAVEFQLGDEKELAEAIEGNVSKPIAKAGEVNGKLVFAGIADKDFDEELKEKLKGNIAFIDRGAVTFYEKINRAQEAGAIGAIVANNKDGAAFGMGGDKTAEIPAIMITKALGDKIKEQMKSTDVTIDFNTEGKIAKKELVDTITGFSSRGPRSLDALIKPEIVAPGYQIISADVGKGTKGVAMNGTSMSGPHMAGVMTLLKEKFKTLKANELKAIAMNTAKLMDDEKDKPYPVARQGSGLVQIDKAIQAEMIVTPPALSLGEFELLTKKTIVRKVTIKNLKGSAKFLTASFVTKDAVEVKIENEAILLKENGEAEFYVEFTFDAKKMKSINELEGYIHLSSKKEVVARVPFLAVVKKQSLIEVPTIAQVNASKYDADGATVNVTLKNKSKNEGVVLPFNMIGSDARKALPTKFKSKSRICDLQAVGYRVIEEEGKKFLEFGTKIYTPVSRWEGCQVSLLFDYDGDGEFEQELAGVANDAISGLDAVLRENGQYSVLVDVKKMKSLRKAWEVEAFVDTKKRTNYLASIEDIQEMDAHNHTTVSVVRMDMDNLKQTTDGNIFVKVAVISEDGVEADDFLGEKGFSLNIFSENQSFKNLPAKVKVGGNKTETLRLIKGKGNKDLLLLIPSNPSLKNLLQEKDLQSFNLTTKFKY